MANLLTADDATFAATTGNWQASASSTLTRQTSPTSPDGNNVGRLANNGSGSFVGAQIPRGIYPVAFGDLISMELAYNVPGTISGGSDTLFCQIAVVVYQANPAAAGASMGLATSDPFVKGSGWGQVVIPEFTVGLVGGQMPAWVGASVSFGPWEGSGFNSGDVAYFSDVYLGEAPPVAVGGWAVGVVRMGAN